MHFFFGDDSTQKSPTRDKMGAIIAVGGILVAGSSLGSLERALDHACTSFGFPSNEEFKWSPGKDKWMRGNLVADNRKDFFLEILRIASEHKVKCLVVMNDITCRTATGTESHNLDTTITLLERVHHRIPCDSEGCIIIVDRPSGGRSDEDKFLLQCLEQIQSGTAYVKYQKFVLNVLSTPSKLIRTLQLADLVTSCCLARVSGESCYSPIIFEKIINMCPDQDGRKGGASFKIHPDYKYANLYCWLLGDKVFIRSGIGHPLPISKRPYSLNENAY